MDRIEEALPQLQARMASKDTRSELLEDIQLSQAVFLQRHPGQDSVWNVVWDAKAGTTVVIFEGAKQKAPRNWKYRSVRVSHSKLGGVTAGTWCVSVYTRCKFDLKFDVERPRQDFRNVQKFSMAGVRSYSPDASAKDPSIATQVNKIRGGILSTRSLLPKDARTKRYLVRSGTGSLWVTREVLCDEILAAWDVPETMYKDLADKDKQSMIEWITVPGKIVEQVIKWICGSTDQLNQTSKYQPQSTVALVSKDTSQVLDIVQDKHNNLHDRALKATKSDNAGVPEELWDSKLAPANKQDLDVLRQSVLCWWRRQKFAQWRKWKDGRKLDKIETDYARDVFSRIAAASWWEWKDGSRLCYWNWPEEVRAKVKDGIPPWYTSALQPWFKAQRAPNDAKTRALIMDKINLVIERRYLEVDTVHSLMSFFAVPKGDADIRLVYDGTASGLNDTMWTPWFHLPTVDSLCRCVEPGYFLSDNDVGEMFLNFNLHETICVNTGIDLSKFLSDYDGRYYRWNRPAMGLRISPYQCVQSLHWAKEMAMGERHDPGNVFCWNKVKLNLPGSKDYLPDKPWVYKERLDGRIASDVNIYVDDLRPTGALEEECWKASQRVSGILGHLGLQDAARKRRPPSQCPGSWAGANVETRDGSVWVTVSQEKWTKLQGHVARMESMMKNPTRLPHKELLSIRGFIIYIARAFPALNVYLKGLHHTIDSWRPDRDSDGWKVRPEKRKKRDRFGVEIARGEDKDWNSRWIEMQQESDAVVGEIEPNLIHGKAPTFVKAVARFKHDLRALKQLVAGELPPRRRARPQRLTIARYGFGDASGPGYGSSVWTPGGEIVYRSDLWPRSITEECSSNFRELANVVQALEDAASRGLIENSEVWMFTDNSTAEAAFFKGTARSPALFELILRLKKLELSSDGRVFVVHVAGRRMIWQGTDALSRGDSLGGVMAGTSFGTYIPTHTSGTHRSRKLNIWLDQLAVELSEQGCVLVRLNPEGWLDTTWARNYAYCWDLAPSSAPTALEYLAECVLKRPWSMHIVIVPRIMTGWWHKLCTKICDFTFTVPIGSELWEVNMFEPLTISIYLPLSQQAPWRHRHVHTSREYAGSLQEMWKAGQGNGRDLLCKLLVSSQYLACL